MQDADKHKKRVLVVGRICEELSPLDLPDASHTCSDGARWQRPTRIGGAANVARHLGEAGVQVGLQCVCGEDAKAIDSQYGQFLALLPQYDMIAVSDFPERYIGNLPGMIQAARKAGKKTVMEPDRGDFASYAGASMLVVGESRLRIELQGWRDDWELNRKTKQLMQDYGFGAVLVNRDQQGISIYAEKFIRHFPLYKPVGGDVLVASVAHYLLVNSSESMAATRASMSACGSRMRQGLSECDFDELTM